ncbi:hypothetical protein ACSQ67_016474 [Phaseolus vulgaris]
MLTPLVRNSSVVVALHSHSNKFHAFLFSLFSFFFCVYSPQKSKIFWAHTSLSSARVPVRGSDQSCFSPTPSQGFCVVDNFWGGGLSFDPRDWYAPFISFWFNWES